MNVQHSNPVRYMCTKRLLVHKMKAEENNIFSRKGRKGKSPITREPAAPRVVLIVGLLFPRPYRDILIIPRFFRDRTGFS